MIIANIAIQIKKKIKSSHFLSKYLSRGQGRRGAAGAGGTFPLWNMGGSAIVNSTSRAGKARLARYGAGGIVCIVITL